MVKPGVTTGILILLGLALLFTLFSGISPFAIITAEEDFSTVPGAEFNTNQLPVDKWKFSGCFKTSDFGSVTGCAEGKGPVAYIDTATQEMQIHSVGGNAASLEYLGDVIGKDVIISHDLVQGTSVCIHYSYAGCNVRNCRGETRTAITGLEGKGQFKIISSRLDPTKAVAIFSGSKVCDIDLTSKQPPRNIVIGYDDTTSPESRNGILRIKEFKERIPFVRCSINKGAGEVLVSEVIPAGKSFDRFSLSFPPEKFCLGFGAYLYDPTRGFDEDPVVYQKLQAGESLTLPFDTKVVYVVLNKDPVTGQARFGNIPECASGQAADTKSLNCDALGGFVDLCRNGILDPEQGSCIQTRFDTCDGVIRIKDDGTRVCETFLPNLDQLCESGSIQTVKSVSGNFTKCAAPSIDCGIDHNLIQISRSEFKCVPKQPAVPTSQEPQPEKVVTEQVQQAIETAPPESLLNLRNVLIGILVIIGIVLYARLWQ